jgi:hypothetical protein
MESIITDMIIDFVKDRYKEIDNASDIIDCLNSDQIDEIKEALWFYFANKLNYSAILKEIWEEESESE